MNVPIAKKGDLKMGQGGSGEGEGKEGIGGGLRERGKTARVFSPTILTHSQS